jgi:DNA-binding GntR family transcriptional regulator
VDQCVSRILGMIQSGELQPGQRLGEGMLSRRLKLGRAPVKAALDQLAFAGVVERRPRSGSYVRNWSMDDYLQLLHLRGALESMAARLAATRITPEQLQILERLARELDTAGPQQRDDPQWISTREIAFHTEVALASGNRWLVRALADQRVVADCVLSWLRRPSHVQFTGAGAPHQLLVNALRSGDAELAARAMLTHVIVPAAPTDATNA